MARHLLILAGIILLIAIALFQIVTKVDLDLTKEIQIEFKDSKNNMLQLKSSAFENNGLIPAKYTCDAENINPSLEWSGVPKNTVSLALIMDDPDVPKNLKPDGIFNHWAVFNIPPKSSGTGEGIEPSGTPGANGAGKEGYIGPCPPDREHRYFFRLYALDTTLSLTKGSTKSEILKAMEGHIIEETLLLGRYDRKH